MMKTLKKLYVMQVKNEGIPERYYHFLEARERKMLVQKGEKFYLKPHWRRKLKVVLAGGVFDILHLGHAHTLSEAKKHGDVLIVAVAQDKHIKNKKRKPIHTQDYRAIMVELLKPVDAAVLGKDRPEDTLKRVEPDVIVYGYDQKAFMKPKGTEVVMLKEHVEPDKLKTSRIIKSLGL